MLLSFLPYYTILLLLELGCVLIDKEETKGYVTTISIGERYKWIRITYKYEVNNKIYKSVSSYSPDSPIDLKEGDTLNISYFPLIPSINTFYY